MKTCLERLEKRFDLTREELRRVRSIRNCEFISISIASSGGFEAASGEFQLNDNPGNYRVKITFSKDDDSIQEFILLKGNT
ncbi:hypothetical protein MKO06_11205 [Gramella sp. GC03-9]|uniref:Uncharacterized protein n=1 Tax=Christiangramia oceanisediminis TaxID=2920386 RepID=A0A9X2KY62_9FLAO|nr:hypothetical protein [Gramella oceanisediminis]MCP9200480.1 hypothetical protein [Gramella oceanisediminis]